MRNTQSDTFTDHALWYKVADVVIMAMSPTDGHWGSVHDASLHVEDFLESLHGHTLMCEKVSAWVCMTMKAMYTVEILSLT